MRPREAVRGPDWREEEGRAVGQARAQTRDTPCPPVGDTGLVRPGRARLELRTVLPEAGWVPTSLGRGPKARVRPRAVSAVCSWYRFEPREPRLPGTAALGGAGDAGPARPGLGGATGQGDAVLAAKFAADTEGEITK